MPTRPPTTLYPPLRLYGPLPFFLAKLVATVPVYVLCAGAYAATTYGMQGLRMEDQPGGVGLGGSYSGGAGAGGRQCKRV